MATRREWKVNPLDLKKNTAIGVMLPLGGTPIFKLSYTTEEQSLSNLKNLLLTRKGERPFQPLFGTSIYSMLFENMDLNLEERLESELRSDIKYWLPYIIVESIIVDSNEDANSIRITLNVKVTESGANTPIIIYVNNQGNLSIV